MTKSETMETLETQIKELIIESLNLEGMRPEDIDTETDENSDSKSDKYKNEVIIVDSDGEETALVKKIIEPKVKGVIIVCSGGGNIEIKEKVIKAVSSALNISTNSICVEKG